MREPKEIEELIYQSVKESDLFNGKWEGMLYSNLLKMILIKGGGVEEFLQHYSPYFDSLDLEWFFKDDLIQRYGEDGYQLFMDMVLGE
ncbi:hypothetical protein [uncultured Desulfobacter sp.]|uniref:hypothetical protein n=1 Tax=uncultured Desulfobacter sp. TaxID=240139 RepID=UPI0029C8290F|nr:hypothetical protein [uncultured Desulfobacter sp.]